MGTPPDFNADLDLYIDRHIAVAPSLVWRAWTEPNLLKQWFTPKPWQTTDCAIDVRPGGIFRTVMQGPNGETHDGAAGCFLDVVPERRLVFTDGLGPGWRPNTKPFMTAVITMAAKDGGTAYAAHVLHASPEDKTQHEAMGFHDGWGTAITQLADLATTLAATSP